MKFSRGGRRAINRLRRQFKMTGNEVYDPGKAGRCHDRGVTRYIHHDDLEEWKSGDGGE